MENIDDNLPKSNNFTTLFKYDTQCSADSVEWCPHEPNRHVFVCGTYQLTKEQKNRLERERLGRILLFSLKSEGLELIQLLETPAILDQKWCPNEIDGLSILGVVNAKRTLELYKLQNNKLMLLTKFVFLDDETETLILSLDWSTGKYESQQPHIGCSDSKGNVHVLQLANEELVLQTTWHGHSFQAWITGFYYWDTNLVFSGGDDALFLKFDRRCGDAPVSKIRQHDAGVTSFHCNKSREYIVVTGSYDEHVRLWDIRNMKYPRDNLKMPGPLWRLKWDPFCQNYLLAACMLGGVHLIEAGQQKEMSIVDSYYEHKNISYGADWCLLEKDAVDDLCKGKGNVIIGSCSFYDHLLCVSSTIFDINGSGRL